MTPASETQMKKGKYFGWGSLSLGLAAMFAGLFEWSAGEFMPGGYRNDVHWLVSSTLVRLYREYGPYVSGFIWLGLAAVCFRVGVGMVLEATAWSRTRDSSQASRLP
jgi:hypothetical protein